MLELVQSGSVWWVVEWQPSKYGGSVGKPLERFTDFVKARQRLNELVKA